MTRRFAIGLAAAALAACIENPEPDARLLLPDPEVRDEWAPATAGRYPLRFRFVRDTAGTFLSLVNLGARIDSLEFLVEIRTDSADGSGKPPPDDFRPPAWSLHARLPWVASNATHHLGRLDSLPAGSLHDFSVTVGVLRGEAEGTSAANPHGGAYSGTFAARDTAGALQEGAVDGWVGADGQVVLTLYGAGRTPLYRTGGTADSAGAFRRGFFLMAPDRWPPVALDSAGVLRREAGRLRAAFRFRHPGRELDSLAMDLVPGMPREFHVPASR